jgi:hypothetical protein
MAYVAASLGGLGCAGNRPCAGCRGRTSGCAGCGKPCPCASCRGAARLSEWYVADDEDNDGRAPRRLSGGAWSGSYYGGKRVIRPLIVR